MSCQFSPSDPEETPEGTPDAAGVGASHVGQAPAGHSRAGVSGADESGAEPSGSDGPRLVEPFWAELSALTARATENRAAMSALHAQRAEICAEAVALVADRVLQRAAARGRTRNSSPFGDDIPLREVIAELGAALRVSDQTLKTWFGDGDALVRTYPDTLDALRTGRIDERQASAIIDGGHGLDDDHRGAYQEQVLAAAEEQTAPALRETARVISARLQPDVFDARQKAAHERRRIRAYSLDDALARLQIDGPAALVFAMYDRATQMATLIEQDAKAEAAAGPDTNTGSGANAGADTRRDSEANAEAADSGADSDADATQTAVEDPTAPLSATDDRCRDELRFDIIADLLLTGTPSGHGDPNLLSAIRGTIQVTVPALTLAGLDNDPALLAGHGPIDTDTARTLAGAAPGWDRILTHPTTGIPLTVDRYRPTPAQKRLLKARDQHCRWPGCRRPVRYCDDEHNIPHSEGGHTCLCNMCEFCRRHHTLKHASQWTIHNHGDGTIEFTSPTGRTYRTNAPPVLQHIPPKWMRPPEPFIDDPEHPVPF